MATKTTLVSIIMGSQSDWPVMKKTVAILDQFGISHDTRVISAHRKNARLQEYIKEAEASGARIFIAGAGMAAHLPGVVAALTTLPVIGVPLKASLDGLDSLLAIVQMPPGIPVATMSVGPWGARNAAIFAARILALRHPKIAEALDVYREEQRNR